MSKNKTFEDTIFSDEFLERIGFERRKTGSEPQYGKAVDKRTVSMTSLQWNNEGHSCNYFGEAIERNISFAIFKDAGTRTAFNGYVFNAADVIRLLELTA